MKALIVDDEYHVFQAVQILVEWGKYGVIELLYADNGVEALKIMEEKKPELVFTDMQMPEMSGEEFLKQLRDKGFTCQVIAISGYNDFRYMKALIQASGIDYILKPINKSELIAAVERAINKRRQQSKEVQMIQQVKMADKEEAKRIIINWLDNHKKYDGKVHDALNRLGAGNGYYRVAVVLLKNPEKITEDIFEGDWNDMEFCLDNIAKDVFEESEFCKVFVLDDYLRLILTQTPFFDESRYETKLKRYGKLLKGIMCIESFCAFSEKIVGEEEIPEQIKSLKKELLSKSIFRTKNFAKELSSSNIIVKEIKSLANIEYVLNLAVQNKDREAIGKIITDFCNDLKKKSNLTLYELQLYTTEINLVVKRMVSNIKEQNGMLHLREISLWIFELDNWEEHVKESFYELCTNNNSNAKSITAVYAYIQEHYSENITMADLSELFCQSPQYLSKQFKNHYGTTIGDTLRNIRMEKAKKLLKYSQLLVSEIAHEVGFDDDNYFSKVFKNNLGVSPLQYIMCH